MAWLCVSQRKIALSRQQRAGQGVFFSHFKHQRFCVALLAVAFAGLQLLGVSSPALAEGPRHAAMVVDGNTGKVLHDANGSEARYPASLTKLMTLYLVFEALEKGQLTLNTELEVSEAAAAVAPSKLGIAPGQTVKLNDAVKALVTKSANDMAVAIAEKIGGTERNFARLMTERARQIGMASTTFRNASGLPDSQQLTTARDMVTLAMRLKDDFPDRSRVFSLREFTYQGKTYRTHNTLMKSFAGMDGMKTGYTSASGFNLVASVRRDGKYIFGAVFGGATASSRNAHMRNILTRALDDASTERTRESKPRLIASARPAARPQRDEARPQKEPAKIAKDNGPPVTKVAAAATAPKPAVKPTTAKLAAPSKPVLQAAAVNKPDVSSGVPMQQVSVAAPPDAPVSPAPLPATEQPTQRVSVAPPIVVASVKTVPIVGLTPPVPQDAAQKSDRIGAQTADLMSTQLAAPVAAPSVAEASAKLDFAALRQAIASTKVPTTSANTAAPAPTAPPRDDETIIAKDMPAGKSVLPATASAPGRPPSTFGQQVAQLQPAAGTPETGTVLPPARPPSTLGGQAASLTEAVPVAADGPPMRLSGPQAATPAVQIGAYASQAEAQRQLAGAQSRAMAVLASATPFSRRIESGGRQLYAARFGGFDQDNATRACTELRRLAIDCFVVQSK